MTKFNVGNRVEFVNNGGYSLDDNQQAGTIRRIDVDMGPMYYVKIDNYPNELGFLEDELIPVKSRKNATNDRLTEAEAEIKSLKSKVRALEAMSFGVTIQDAADAMMAMAKAGQASANSRRADVIKRAQAFVADIITEVDAQYGWQSTVIPLYKKIGRLRIEFVVNAEKRTVVALARYGNLLDDPSVITKAVAKCAPGDVFNAIIGMAIALGRALGVKVPKEFTDAVKPTEVVVGMRVRHKDTNITVKPPGRYDYSKTGECAIDSPIVRYRNPKIVDDTEAQY